MQIKHLALVAATALLSTAAIATSASADTQWAQRHPRQDQILDRVANQRHEIRNEVREGDLSRAQGRRLTANDNRIAREDHVIARANGGYITKHEQRVLNHQENRNLRHIPS